MISTHILDTSCGDPAGNVKVSLEIRENDEWQLVDENNTNTDGRIAFDCPAKEGVYRLLFHVSDYFEAKSVEHFFLKTPVIFKVTNINRKYHVPLLVNPFGYSTYRGS
jgi:5-hydroxyisourate hydrolase